MVCNQPVERPCRISCMHMHMHMHMLHAHVVHVTPASPSNMAGQVAGYFETYATGSPSAPGRNFTFLTVKGAGHMVGRRHQ